MLVLRSFGLAALTFALGCGGKVLYSSGGDGIGGGSTSTVPNQTSSSGSAGPAGTCNSDADCNGKACIAVSPSFPGSIKVCADGPALITSCDPGDPGDAQCCSSADCVNQGGGSCFPGGVELGGCPSYNAPGQCTVDGCTSDNDCGEEIDGLSFLCASAGIFDNPVRGCIPYTCRADSDCTAESGGYCRPIVDPCCTEHTRGLACVYPGGCTKTPECSTDNSSDCEIQDGQGVCVDGVFGCAL